LITSTCLGGTSSTYLLRRLKRDHVELAAKVVSGELSANAAAIEAGAFFSLHASTGGVQRSAIMSARLIASSGGEGHRARWARSNACPKNSVPQRGHAWRMGGRPPRWVFRRPDRMLAAADKISPSSTTWPQDNRIPPRI
jgi:hypothetical protein